MTRLPFYLAPILTLLTGSCEQGDQEKPAVPRVYRAVAINAPITVDGDLDEPQWESGHWTEDFVDILGTDRPNPPLRTRLKLLWDNDFLFLGAEMEEPHLWATLTNRDAIIYRDDDFEVFLDPYGDGGA